MQRLRTARHSAKQLDQLYPIIEVIHLYLHLFKLEPELFDIMAAWGRFKSPYL